MNLKKIITVFIVVLTIFVIMCSSFTVSAVVDSSTLIFNIPISKPNVTEELYVMEVLYGDDYNNYVDVYLINLTLDTYKSSGEDFLPNEYEIPLNVLVYDNGFHLVPSAYNPYAGYRIEYSVINNVHNEIGFGYSLDEPKIIIYPNSWKIKGIRTYGNFEKYWNMNYENNSNFVVNYGSDASSNILLGQILSAITNGQQNQTNQIIQNQNENTDKVLNGDADLDSSGETGKVDGTIGGIDNATSEALGGKSDEQVQQEISGALDTDKIGLDFNKAQRISNFFDRTLEAFGVSYKTLLLLSLCLGLSAFLIGRRYA